MFVITFTDLPSGNWKTHTDGAYTLTNPNYIDESWR